MNQFINEIIECYDVNYGSISVNLIVFNRELIKYCEMNSCGNYGRNYMCPPFIGETESNIAKIKQYNNAIVFQKVYQLEDSYDYDGMMDGQKQFKEIVQKIKEKAEIRFDDSFILGVGGCKLCSSCAVQKSMPCRYPQKAVSSLESYCIDVSQLAGVCNLNYINGLNIVTYFGTLFLK